ncbi:MAG: fimbrial protein [Rhodanobacter sp.]
MNKKLLSTALFAVIAATSIVTTAQASDGTINITGKVVGQTCKVEGAAFGTPASKTVPLALVLAPVLSAAGNTANKTAFSLNITGCDSALTTVQTQFSGTNIDATTGNLKLTGATPATNVQIQLLNASSAVMPLNGASATAQNSQTVNLTAGAATMSYYAQYIAVGGAAGVGLANSSVEFTMNYL